MKIINPISTGTYDTCKPGNLVILGSEYRPATFAIFLWKHDYRAFLCVLSPGKGVAPHITATNTENECVFLAASPVFQIVLADTPDLAVSSAESNVAGNVTIRGTKATLRIDRDPDQPDVAGGHVDLATFKLGTDRSLGNAVVMKRWRVWLNEEDIDRPGKQPLVSFGC